mgnify:CR=1 FL=1
MPKALVVEGNASVLEHHANGFTSAVEVKVVKGVVDVFVNLGTFAEKSTFVIYRIFVI